MVDGRSKLPLVSRYLAPLAGFFLIVAAGCDRSAASSSQNRSPTTLTVGFGLTTGQSAGLGIRDTIASLTLERLVSFGVDGRPQARLAERWSVSPDGLSLKLWLRSGATFHNGQPVTATIVRKALADGLPSALGTAFKDVRDIVAIDDHTVEVRLHRRSAFVFEGFEIAVQQPGDPPVGTGPFFVANISTDQVELRAYQEYYGGKPLIDRILVNSYGSIRSAWADILRGQVDMLYEVGQDAFDSLQPSSNVKVFTIQRPYAYVVVLNMRRSMFRDAGFRRALNAAIDRNTLVSDVFDSHATPAVGPVSANHWAYDSKLPTFKYEPKLVNVGKRIRIACLFADSSLEELALTIERQFEAIGVDLELELLPLDQWLDKVTAGDFDAYLADAALGPSIMRSYRLWHSGEQFNWGQFNSKQVDAALDAIRDASNDADYREGVAAFQRAIIVDPPAIFLTWSERARAVSTRFDVPVEPGLEILSTLRLWRPVDLPKTARRD